MRVRVTSRELRSRDHHCLSGRDAGYGFRDGISRDLSIFARFSHFLLFLMTLGSRGARSASRGSKLSLGLRIWSIFKVLKAEEIGLAFRLGLGLDVINPNIHPSEKATLAQDPCIILHFMTGSHVFSIVLQ